MVRFHWFIGDSGHAAWVPMGGVTAEEDKGVRHVTVDMELAGQNETVMSLLTVPSDCLQPGRVSPLGLVLAHGGDAGETWKGPLMERLACDFAAAGHAVVRYYCPLKEQRRHRILEKAFDAAASSPYCAAVQRWAFVGLDNGARIAAGVAAKATAHAEVAGLALLSYPLLQPAPPPPKQKAGAAPPADSVGALSKLGECPPHPPPVFFLCGEFDRLCPGDKLQETVAEALPGCDVRAVVLEGLSGRFCEPGTKELEGGTLDTIVQHVQSFVKALKEEGQGGGAGAGAGLAACPLPKAADLVPSTRPLPDVLESPKKEASPELEEPEPESPPTVQRGRGMRRPSTGAPAAAAAALVAAVGMRPGLPAGMIPVMGPNGQPILVSAAAVAANPAAQQMLMMQQQLLAAHIKQQQAVGGGGVPTAQQLQQLQQMQMMMAMQQQMAAAAAARPGGVPAGTVPAAAPVAPSAAAAAVLLGQQQQAAGGQGAAPMAVDP
ncbi:GMP synthase [glutamine-hydrolyzing] [Micractinium conductrix]|uniref:GMP synthase [glutamine-hydrolyzing] n=1 Tax=Micractinium conductrix TaxID=554055 RepID=A0A2P6V8B1_9CHLO|nr:GMP synthase [glutamine-hydrolyzing] [Micractinium conductrix]|eukprot:PSC70326.1 GMP synthase [glutamine-hydrolyzing] [Micractinium conductrix]